MPSQNTSEQQPAVETNSQPQQQLNKYEAPKLVVLSHKATQNGPGFIFDGIKSFS